MMNALNYSSYSSEIDNSLCIYPVGCSDPNAANYNPAALDDDGSCIEINLGCTDPNYLEYDSQANINNPASCINVVVPGCMNPNANNYNSLANFNNYECDFDVVFGCLNSDYLEYNPLAEQDNEVSLCQNLIVLGCTNSNFLDYDPSANVDDGSCQSLEYVGCADTLFQEYDSLYTVNDQDMCLTPHIYGCTNRLSQGGLYNPDATTDDASCIITGCMENAADNYNASANNAGACNYAGCTNASACNYDAIHNVEDGSCTYATSGYDCSGVCLLDADGDGVCDPFEVIGCTDTLGCNFDDNATDDGFCTYPSASYLNCDGNCNFDSDGDGICDENESTGCTNSLAINYNPAATDDDGSCIAPILGCTDSTASNYDGAANTDNGLCQYPGCTDASAFNYDDNANVNDGSCIAVVQGCTDGSAFNYNASANTDDGSCEAVLVGCMVSGAINYNPNANTEGECTMPEAGFEIVNSNTGNNALIFIADTAFSLADGANLGAFFIDENGDSQCAGVVSWNPSGGNLIVVHGDDPNTAAIDGAQGEIIWQTNIDGQGAVLFAEYSGYGPENIVGSNQYAANAAYYITSFTLAIEGCMNSGYMEYDASANVDDGSCNVLYSVGLANAEAQIDNMDSVIAQLSVDLFNTQSALADSIYSYESQLVAMQAAWDQEVLDSVTWWSDKYNLDMINLQNSMQAIIDQMQSEWDDEVDSLENELVILNQGLSDSIASYEGQLSDMQASWDADTLDYHNQLVALQASLDSTVADYQDQLSTLVDNHADAVAELNGQLAALQGQYDGAVASYEDSISTMHINWDNEVATLQAAWDAAVDQLTQDATDSAAAALALLNLTIDNYVNDLANMETSYLGQISQLNSAYSDSISQILYEDVLEDAAYDSQISSLESDTLLLNSQIWYKRVRIFE